MAKTKHGFGPPNELEIHVEKSIQHQAFHFYVRIGDKFISSIAVTQEPLKEECAPFAPSAHLKYDMARLLFQAMWDAGLRPEGYSTDTSETEALKNHLEDMRTLAFDAIGTTKPTLK